MNILFYRLLKKRKILDEPSLKRRFAPFLGKFKKFSKKFAKIGLPTTGGCGFNPDFCYAPQIFFTAHAIRA